MGLFSRIFGGSRKIASAASSVSFLQTYSGGSGGWGLDRFNSVVNAHSSIEGIVDEFSLADEGCDYMSLDGYDNPWTQAYEEALARAEIEAAILEMLGEEVDPEDLIDWEQVEERAYNYACQLAQAWLDGSDWIPEEVMDWAWYDLSDHNL